MLLNDIITAKHWSDVMRSTEILQSRTGNENIFSRFQNAIKKNWELYLMFLPVAVFYIMFCYRPMYGIIMAFQDYVPRLGLSGSSWTGFLQFERFFSNHYFWRLLKNTFTISGLSILVGFPAPIIFALLLNEIKNSKYKRTVQTITYLPHFISIVVICSMIRTFTADNGVLTNLAVMLGGSRKSMLNDANLFVPIYVLSDIWQNMGWSSIIYIAALSGINTELYEAAQIDGANRWKQVLHVTLPGIMPTITIMLILRLGGILSVEGFNKPEHYVKNFKFK